MDKFNSLMAEILGGAMSPDEAVIEACIDIQTEIITGIKDKEVARRLYMDTVVLGATVATELGAKLEAPLNEVLEGFNRSFESGWDLVHNPNNSGLQDEVSEEYSPFNTINS